MPLNLLLVDNRQGIIDEFKSADWGENYLIHVLNSQAMALNFLADQSIDLVFMANKLDGTDGVEIIREIKKHGNGNNPLFIILSDESDYRIRVRQMTEHIDEFIRVPFHSKELVLKTNILASELQGVPKRSLKLVASFSGKLSEMNLLDLLQSLELGEKSGIIYLQHDLQHGKVYLQKGLVCEAELSEKSGKDAFMSMTIWSEGTFVVEFTSAEIVKKVEETTKELISQGRELLCEWNDLKNNFSDFEILFEVEGELNRNLLDAKSQALISLVDEGKKLKEILIESPLGEVETLQSIKDMAEKGILRKAINNGIHKTEPSSDDQPNEKSNANSNYGSQIMDNFVQGIVNKNKSAEDLN